MAGEKESQYCNCGFIIPRFVRFTDHQISLVPDHDHLARESTSSPADSLSLSLWTEDEEGWKLLLSRCFCCLGSDDDNVNGSSYSSPFHRAVSIYRSSSLVCGGVDGWLAITSKLHILLIMQ